MPATEDLMELTVSATDAGMLYKVSFKSSVDQFCIFYMYRYFGALRARR
jgi:hypothetical protein